MRAGELDAEILIEQVTLGTDAAGGVTKTWSTFDTVRARVRFQGGRERDIGDRTQGESDVIFRIRYRAGIVQTMRVTYDGDVYQVTRVDKQRRMGWIDMHATARDLP